MLTDKTGTTSGTLKSAVVFLAGLMLASLSGGVLAAARSLQSIDYQTMADERVLVTLTLSDSAPQPVVFTVDKPARVALDLPDTRLDLANRYSKIDVGNTRAVAAAEARGRSRVVIELVQLAPYNVSVDGNKIYVQLGNATDTALAPAPSAGGSTSSGKRSASARSRASSDISNVDFRRGEKGAAQVVVTLGNPGTPVNVSEKGGKVIAEFPGTTVPDSLLKRLDVMDFATPAKYVDVTRVGTKAIITVTPASGADFEQVAYQTGSQFTLELQPLTAEKLAELKTKPKYTGERISLNFQNVDVRALLQIIADVAGVNMVVSDSVQGSVAMRLQNVPWDQALDIILTTKNLGKQQEGNVVLVAPAAEIAAREKAALEAEAAKVVLEPLRSEVIQINFAKASEIATLLKSTTGEKGNSALSDRGSVTVDDRTNTLIVVETRAKLEEVRKLVALLDIPVKQVLIETRIVIANSDYSKDLGARFGYSAIGSSGSTVGTTSGNLNGTTQILNGEELELADRLNFALPAAPSAGSPARLALAILSTDYLIEMELSALQREGRGEIVSTPRVVTANGKEATIEQGVEIPYQQASASGATTVTFKKAVLSLGVTPQITPDNHVTMNLNISKDSVGSVVSDTLGGSIPSIDTRKVSSQVLVDNGETVVLGGIYEETNTKTKTKVPLLGDVPLLGVLFRNNSFTDNKKELLVFVTPKILKEGLNIAH
jgi:type IV pilus assembly protein PilQ